MSCYLHPKHFTSRIDMIGMIPKGARIAEVGVFDGSFSAELLETAQPSELVLIDLWADELVESGNVDGNNVRRIHGRELETTVRSRFAGDPRVRVIRGTAADLAQYPRGYFDAIYIDADHSYDAVRQDLEHAFPAVKDGGWLMGHDYGVNPDRTDARWSFGVREAVDAFCRDMRQQIHSFAMDGCTSFAVRVDRCASGSGEFAVSLRKLRTRVVRKVSRFAASVSRAAGVA